MHGMQAHPYTILIRDDDGEGTGTPKGGGRPRPARPNRCRPGRGTHTARMGSTWNLNSQT